MNIFKQLSIAFLFAGIAQTSTAQLYTAGDIVDNFTLTNRATGQPVTLHDFDGKIVFLEWFAHWCPFCQAAAAEVGPNIIDYYGETNSNGVPFMHVAVNLQGDAETQTQAFINFYGLDYVAEDFTRSVSARFSTNGQPIFAIINGAEDSSTHAQWELLYSRSGYLSNSTPIEDFRTAIDSVMPSAAVTDPPAITQQPTNITVAIGGTLSLSVTATSEEDITYQWYKDSEIISGATSNSIDITAATLSNAGEYYVIASNSIGGTTSESAVIAVGQTLADYLIEQSVPQNSSAPDQDADNDGASNLLEYISKTDPTDPESRPVFKAILQTMEGATYLDFEVVLNTSILEYTTAVEFSDNIDFSTTSPGSTIEQQDNGEGSEVLLTRSSTSIGTGDRFARLAITKNP